MKILVAEDDPVSRKILSIALGKTPHEILFAEDGLKAWEIFQKYSVETVITDWIMPQMDGLTLCKKIRSTKKEDYTYIIVLTTKNRKMDMVKVLEGGADDYITKPFDQGELRARLMTGERILKREQQYKNMQNTLIESRNKLRVVFDSLDDEIIVIDVNFKIVSINKMVLRNKSISYEETIDKVCFLNKDGKGSPYFEEETVSFIKETFVTGESKVFVQTSTSGRNQKIYNEIHCVPIKDNSGSVFQVMIVSRNITSERRRSEEIEALNREVKRAYSEIKEKNDELENTLQKLKTSQAHMIHSEKMASIGQLAAGIAHEINTPIQYVGDNTRFLSEAFSSFTEVYERHIKLFEAIKADEPLVDLIREVEFTTEKADIEYLIQEVPKAVEQTMDGVNQVAKIVRSMRKFSHPGQEEKTIIDINEAIESTITVARNEWKYVSDVVTDFDPSLPPVPCFPGELNQVFLNMITNAAHSIGDVIGDGSNGKGIIKISTRSFYDSVQICISDTGTGIPEEIRSQIFDPFFTTKEVGKGTGQGLAISYSVIVEKHGGVISFDTEMGKGTTFTIRLPSVHP